MTKRTRNILTLALTFAMLMAFSGIASAYGHDNGRRGGERHYKYAPMAQLTPEQSAVAERLHAEFEANTESARQQLILKRAELQAEMVGSNPNPQKIEKLSGDIGALKGKILAQRNILDTKLTEAGIRNHTGGPCSWAERGCADLDRGPGRGYHKQGRHNGMGHRGL